MADESISQEKLIVVSPLFQFVFIIISGMLIAFSLYRGLVTFSTADSIPPLETVSPQKLASWGSTPSTVHVGLYIDQFQTFDVVRNNFIFTGNIWFVLVPGAISLNTLEQFEFARGQILYRSAPDTKLIDGQLLVKYNIRVSFNTGVNFSFFPVDNHRIFLTLVHQFVSPNELLFESTQQEFIIIPDLHSYGWNIINKYVASGYLSEKLDVNDPRKTVLYPAVLFSFDCERIGIRYLITILLPLLLIFYLTLFSFSLDSRNAITLSAGGITAILAYRFVIENISPSVGYLMISDYLFFLFLAACFFIFFVVTVDGYARQLSLMQKKLLVMLLHIIIAVVAMYLFLFFS